MFSNDGILTFPVDDTFAANRKAGQLVRVKPTGKITNVMGEGNLLYLPLVEEVVVTGVDAAFKTKSAGCRTHAVAMVYVETATGIDAGDEVGIGATGIGIAAHTSGFNLGTALAQPQGNGDYIPVLLVPTSQGSNY